MTANLLLIDDNATQIAIRQTVLNRVGYPVLTALHPEEALERLQDETFRKEIGVILTDHIMPGMSGSEFVRALRKIDPQIPVVVISGLEEARDEYEGLNVQFRLKPLLPEDLIATVRALLPSSPRSE